MVKESVKVEPFHGIGIQASLNEVLELRTKDMVIFPVGKTKKDLGVRLKRNVSADHVMEKDPQRPNC